MSRNRRSGLEAILALLGAVVSALASVAVAAHLLRRQEAQPSNAGRRGAESGDQGSETIEALPTPTAQRAPESPTPGPPALASQIRPGWHAVTEPLPAPTYWPAVMALGIVFLAWGLISTLLVSGVGLLLFVLALAGWIGDLRHEQREHE